MIPFVSMSLRIVSFEVVTPKPIRFNQQPPLEGVNDYLKRLNGQPVWRNPQTNADYMLRQQQQQHQQPLSKKNRRRRRL